MSSSTIAIGTKISSRLRTFSGVSSLLIGRLASEIRVRLRFARATGRPGLRVRSESLPGARVAVGVQDGIKRGSTSTATTTTSSASDIGRCRNTAALPSPIDTALRSCASASGPRIMPTTTGAVGKVEAPHQHAEHADAVQQHQVERALAHAVGAHRGEDQDAGVQLRLAGSSAA